MDEKVQLNMIHISITNWSGSEEARVEVSSLDTTYQAKLQIQTQTGVSPLSQRLAYEGTPLEDHETFSFYNITDWSTIQLTVVVVAKSSEWSREFCHDQIKISADGLTATKTTASSNTCVFLDAVEGTSSSLRFIVQINSPFEEQSYSFSIGVLQLRPEDGKPQILNDALPEYLTSGVTSISTPFFGDRSSCQWSGGNTVEVCLSLGESSATLTVVGRNAGLQVTNLKKTIPTPESGTLWKPFLFLYREGHSVTLIDELEKL